MSPSQAHLREVSGTMKMTAEVAVKHTEEQAHGGEQGWLKGGLGFLAVYVSPG